MQFQELTDDDRQWNFIRPSSLPPLAYTGRRPRADDNRMMVINGIILYVLMSDCSRWMNIMPSKYGSYKTVWWERHKKKWSEQEGIWKNIIIMDSLVSHGYNESGIQKRGYFNNNHFRFSLVRLTYICICLVYH